jgi:hypothetical protein
VGPPALASEVGPNDLRIGDLGPDGNASFDGRYPAMALQTHH